MMKKNLFLSKFVLLTMVMFSLISINSNGQFVLSGELRPRAEFRHGYKTLASTDIDPAAFVSQRTRLNFAYNDKNLKFKLSFQDIRVWGSTAQLNLTDNFYSVHEAWGELKLNSIISFRLGRQELVYDDSRFLGNVGWAQQSRSHDLALFKYERGGSSKMHIGLAINQDKEQLFNNFYMNKKNYKNMQFLWVHQDIGNHGISFLALNNGIQYNDSVAGASVKYSQTLGTFINLKKNKFLFNGSGYYQMGTDGADKKLSAYMLGVDISYKLVRNINLALGYQLLSGTDESDLNNPDFGNNMSFTPLYGTNHKFNGHMDYFFVGNHTNYVGLQDIFFKFNYVSGKVTFTAFVHHFSTASEVLDPENAGEVMPKYLGLEGDFSIGYKLAKNVNIAAGYSQMFGTETMELIKGGDMNESSNWGWLMITFTPEFLRK